MSAAEKITPSMQQYFDVKEQHPTALLFFRMGDFYEMFFEDAVQAAGALDIALTKRGKHKGEDIAMCGVPAHSAEGYLAQLTRKGFTVAICDQMESPAEAKKRGSKSVVRRDVVRVVTPGTLTEDTLLDARSHNYLASYADVRGDVALGWLDMSSGEFAVSVIGDGLSAELARIAPSEILVTDKVFEDRDLLSTFEEFAQATSLGAASFDSTSAERRLCELFKVSSLDAYGAFGRAELSAMGALVDYIAITQKGALPHIRPPRREDSGSAMRIDAATRRNLELVKTLAGERQGSLLATIDRTVTGAGARLLASRLAAPLTQVSGVSRRQDSIAMLRDRPDLGETCRASLKSAPDIARALSRLSLGRGGPRDLAAIRDGLRAAATLSRAFEALTDPPAEIDEATARLRGHEALTDRLANALAPDLPMLAREGGFIAAGWNAPLDEVRSLRDDSRKVVRDMETRLKTDSGINALKIKFNGVLGYFIEVPPAHADKMTSEEFIHRQTIASAVRYTTGELADLDGRISRAGAQAIEAELALFEELRAAVLSRAVAISAAAEALAVLDVSAALAELAADEGWVRPKVDDSPAFAVEGARHPVVEAALKAGGEPFVANDCDLSDERLWLLTGPNMAGKSTFLRQNALIAVLAQMGSFVPASAAHIGVVDCLFSRVGASDDLARGRSTFMVEMVETAAILNQSGERALVILDEIGRGTATFDGLSIAWATVEHLHDVNKCRGLFATHYHELTELAARLDGTKNAAMKVAEWEGDIVFLHEVEPGAATRSYGVQVARKAGLPASVVARARDVLERLEKGDAKGGEARIRALVDDLPLFAATAAKAEAEKGPSPLDKAMTALDPDTLTPREALDALYHLKALSKDLP
jgi:DNA mismatch repair protein MutS